MNTTEAITLMKRLEAAWPNIFAKNKDREQLYMDVLTLFDYMKASSVVNRLIDDPSISRSGPQPSELKMAISPTLVVGELHKSYRSNETTEGKPIASLEQAKDAFARGYRKVFPEANTEQINKIFGGTLQETETF